MPRDRLFVIFVATDLVNVALRKQSFQVSTWVSPKNGIELVARKANDGIYRTDLGACAASKAAANPWWAVDLEVPTVVQQVNLLVPTGPGNHLDLSLSV